MLRYAVFGGLLYWLMSCSPGGPAARLFRASSPHEQYAQSLRDARLDRTALGTDWLTAADRALRDSLKITVPYRESGYFAATRPVAIGYQVQARRGDKVIIRVDLQGQQPAQVFIDVYELDGNRRERVASSKADTTGRSPQLEWEARRDRTYIIRVQPELLRTGRYTLSVTREPVLSFPVQGLDSRQISSYFGVPRDGGRRRHEGIDIFAPRGTPALASADGIISGVGVNNLGGNVVFLSDTKRSQRLYYAHLDRFNVTEGQRVSVGDTVGFIGNTGNARTTNPHLHFGIYQFNEGAVDPLPYVRRGTGPARQTLPDPDRLGDSIRISATRAVIRSAPTGDAPIVRELPRSTLLTLTGGTATWHRVELPDGIRGYVASSQTEPARRSLRRLPLTASVNLLEAADPAAAVVDMLPSGSAVDVLGTYGAFQLVRYASGLQGWLPRE